MRPSSIPLWAVAALIGMAAGAIWDRWELAGLEEAFSLILDAATFTFFPMIAGEMATNIARSKRNPKFRQIGLCVSAIAAILLWSMFIAISLNLH